MNLTALIPPGPFAIEPVIGQHVWQQFSAVDLHVHMEQWTETQAQAVKANSGTSSTSAQKPYAMSGGVAQLSLSGPMSKDGGPSMSAGSTTLLRRQVRQASADPDVTAILLKVDSPGGEVAGTGDLASDVKAAAQGKPLYAYIEDLGASGAYWVASQSNAIYANPSARVGSIGTYMAVTDLSGAAGKAGAKVHVLKAGAHKGAGLPGAPVTDEHLAHFQAQVDDLNKQFLSAVRQGRGFTTDQMDALADGRVYIGAKARDAGLVNGITSYDNVLAKLRSYKPV